MRRRLEIPRSLLVGVLTLTLFAWTDARAEAQQMGLPLEAFKVGNFDDDGRRFVGLVLRDQHVVELEAANSDFERSAKKPSIPMPETVKSLVSQYEYSLKARLYELGDWVAANRLSAMDRARYVHAVDDLRTLSPLMYPGKIPNAAVNYYEHISEGAPEEVRQEAIGERRADPGVPYLFIKPSEPNTVTGNGEDIVIPFDNHQTDWECEIGIVIGKQAEYVREADADDYIFGYTIEMDMSDRQGRPGGSRFGSDWFNGKGRDTFAPMGPWIVPNEFLDDPWQNPEQRLRLTVNGEVMQHGFSRDMIHNIGQLVEYASWVLTLNPGDVIRGGSPSGVAAGAAAQRGLDEVRYLEAGDELVCSIDPVGAMSHRTVRGKRPPGYELQWFDRGFR